MILESGNKLFGIYLNFYISIVEYVKKKFKKYKRNDYCDDINIERVLWF